MNTQDYLHIFSSIPKLERIDLEKHYDALKDDPSAVLLLAYLQRTLSSKALKNGDIRLANQHCELAWKHLQSVTDAAYGSNDDYVKSMQANTLLSATLALEGDDHMRWYKAVDYCKGLLEGSYPSFYRKDRSDTIGIQINTLLTSLYNRIQKHDEAVHLSQRLQEEASKREDFPTEIRATINWALSTILLSKEKYINGKLQDADALLRSANHVVDVLFKNPSDHEYITTYQPISHALHHYLNHALGGEIQSFITAWSTADDTSRSIMWDLLETHSTDKDEKIMHTLHQQGYLDEV